ncbi:hypothetical protein JCM19236_2706 [Vibrio sp. JCM 19236]|nr:hypothetical protein JCM19236_2706 [Vibrio sp. JCM 19236]
MNGSSAAVTRYRTPIESFVHRTPAEVAGVKVHQLALR